MTFPILLLIRPPSLIVIPAQAGIQRAEHTQNYYSSARENTVVFSGEDSPRWMPAFAGMTVAGAVPS